MVPDTVHAPTATTPGHLIAETETESDFRLQELEPETRSTDDDDPWASATTSPTEDFPVTSYAEDGNPPTSFSDRSSPDTGRAEDFAGAAAGESPVTSFTVDGDPVTSYAVLRRSPHAIECAGLAENTEPVTSLEDNGDPVTSFEIRNCVETVDGFRLIEYAADVEPRMTSLPDVGNTVTPFTNYGHFPATRLAESSDCSAEESPLTSSGNDGNPVTSYHCTVSCPASGDGQVVVDSRSTGNSYQETGSSVMKLVLAAEHGNRPMVLHRIQIPTVGEVLAEVGVAEQTSIESAGSAATTTDQSLALLYNSMLDLSSSRDLVDKDGDHTDRTGGAWTSRSSHRAGTQPEHNAATSDNGDILNRGEELYNYTQVEQPCYCKA